MRLTRTATTTMTSGGEEDESVEIVGVQYLGLIPSDKATAFAMAFNEAGSTSVEEDKVRTRRRLDDSEREREMLKES